MKRLTIFVMVLMCTALSAMAQFSGSGSGTEESPYLIRNTGQLSQMANFCGQDGVVFRLQKDIDITDWLIDEGLTNQGWSPIGTSSQPFKGKLIGNNHKISGLFIQRGSQSYVGFFGYTDGANISDLTIEGTSFVGSSYLGVMAGNAANSTFTNCHVKVSGDISSASGSYAGGFFGVATNCTINDCSVEATVNGTGTKYVGGFAGGVGTGTTISGVTANVTVTSNQECAGGLSGYSNTVTITDTKVIGNVTGTSCVAGFIAEAVATDNITNCTYLGDLTGDTNIGGISAYLAEGSSCTFTSCSTRGKITATGDYVGGIVGVSQGSCIAGMESCSHYGDIGGGNYIGGIVGAVINTTTTPVLHTYDVRYSKYGSPTTINSGYLHSSYSDSAADGTEQIMSINNCSFIGNVIGCNYVGGLIGYNNTTEDFIKETKQRIAYDFNTRLQVSDGNVYWSVFRDDILFIKESLQYYTFYGSSDGFTTYKYIRQITNLSMSNNSFIGTIDGINNIGGVVGYNNGGHIKTNYTHSIINGNLSVGGIIGKIDAQTNLSNLNNRTTLSSNVSDNIEINVVDNNTGRIYGSAETEYITIGELGSNISNRASTKTKVILNGVIQEITDDLQNGTSVGPSALKTKANYQAWGWDFDNDWNIIDGESWPYKKYQAAPPSIVSPLISQETIISGKSLNGGTVYLTYNDQEPIAINCEGDSWSVEMEPLQSGATVTIYAETNDLVPSYPVTYTVSPRGEGTETDPYQIFTAYDLQGISNRGYYKLMNDIDLSAWILRHNPSEGWKPIGLTETPEFMNFDGDNHVIKGLWTSSSNTYNGLFANLSNGGSVKNLTIQVASDKKVQGGDFAGIMAGYAVNLNVENCLVKGDVETANYAGGLIGYAKGGSITKCYTKGNVKATGDNGYAGGLVAWCSTPISNCYSTANVEAPECVAGLVAYSTSIIDKCYAQGNVSGLRLGAGVVAQLSGASATIINSVALNEAITMIGEYASASRVLNGNIDGSPDPDESNLALKTMVVTINDKQEKKYDDEWEGTGKQLSDLMLANAYETLGWDFTNVWGIVENETVPYLLSEIKQGDVNRDGQIDMTDAVCIVYYYLGQRPKLFLTESADMNGDGRIDITDAIIIVYRYLGENGNGANAPKLLEEVIENEPQ